MASNPMKPFQVNYNARMRREKGRVVIWVFVDGGMGKFQHVSGKTWKATVTVLPSGLRYVSTPTFVADHVADPGAAMDEAAEYARVRTKVD